LNSSNEKYISARPKALNQALHFAPPNLLNQAANSAQVNFSHQSSNVHHFNFSLNFRESSICSPFSLNLKSQ
jgi:hypothetical protein